MKLTCLPIRSKSGVTVREELQYSRTWQAVKGAAGPTSGQPQLWWAVVQIFKTLDKVQV